MHVKNRAIIRRLSFKTLSAAGSRNKIAALAIALTALLFTSLFTIALSVNESSQTHLFRQLGGYAHGTFKKVTKEQADAISAHPGVKSSGLRKIIGILSDGVFTKEHAELSYMDENCTAFSYAEPSVGHMPVSENEITMDTAVLDLLGIEPVLGAPVTLTWTVYGEDNAYYHKTDTFTLAGFWSYDNISPVHYINISEEYAEKMQAELTLGSSDSFPTDLNVMLASSLNIRGQMEQIASDLGYTWDDPDAKNNIRIGVNWGYTSSSLSSGIDAGTVLAIISFLILVIFTGYLIIYNIFQISVTKDIRFYGLLKTIGVTPKQLKRIVRYQALMLCAMGIPAGLLAGYALGALLVPLILKNSGSNVSITLSVSPAIFVFAALFALGTVLLSCLRPAKIAAGVSPIEAVRYTEEATGKSREKKTSGAKILQLAAAELGRNRVKTCIVTVSLALSVVLLNILTMFVKGFDMEKYLDMRSCADFIVSTPDYFNTDRINEYISQEVCDEIAQNTQSSLSGCAYTVADNTPQVWMSEASWKASMERFGTEEMRKQALLQCARRDTLVADVAMIEGLDLPLLEKLTVLEGDLSPLTLPEQTSIALVVDSDDYAEEKVLSSYPKIGETVTVTYVTAFDLIDRRTGKSCDENTPDEYQSFQITQGKDVVYTVCAYVAVPHSMSYRYRTSGYEFVLSSEALSKDSEQRITPLFYLFDAADENAEAAAESYLAKRTENDSQLMYESRQSLQEDFKGFQSMFLLLGSLLCVVIGMIGILNFFNTVMTGIFSRQHEFAVLQAVGMTDRQLKNMLVLEGLFYTLASSVIALTLSVVLSPLIANLLAHMFWFFRANFTIAPVLIALPVFALLGYLIPAILYRNHAKHSITERLRNTTF